MPTLEDYYRNKTQYGLEDYTTSTPEGDVQAISYSPGYIEELLALQQRVMSGQGSEWDQENYARQEREARSVPMRDPRGLSYNAGEEGTGAYVSGGSPDLGNLMLTLRDKMAQGTATPEESNLFRTTYTMLADQNFRASVPQESDVAFGLGDNLTGALMTLALGATGGMAAAPLAAGGAGLATTLGSLGTLAGIGGTAAGALGQEMDIDWLRKAGLGLGAAGGIAGGIGGLANLANTGINSLGDAARLASNAGRVVGGVGSLSNNDMLRRAGGYLGMAGQLGGGVDTLAQTFGGGVKDLTDAARLASGLGQVAGVAGRVTGNRPLQQAAGFLGLGGRLGGNVQGLLGAARQAEQRGVQGPVPRTMSDTDWLRWQGQAGPLQANAAPQSVLWNL